MYVRSLTVEISRFRTPEVALALFELIEDIRDQNLALHGEQLREALKDQWGHVDSHESSYAADDDRGF